MAHIFRLPAISRLVLVMSLNDRTEVALPDANPYDGSRLGPKLPVVIVEANIGIGETAMFATG